MPHPTYDNPPVRESICKIQFDGGEEWDSTVPGLFYQEVNEQFPGKDTRQHVGVSPVSEGEQIGLQHQVEERVFFFNEEESTFIQLFPNTIVVNKVRPYQSWEVFRTAIVTAVQAYMEVLSPETITETFLRYRNEIEIPETSFCIADYFHIFPHFRGDFPEDLEAFRIGTKYYADESERNLCQIHLESQERDEETPDESVIGLDLKCIHQSPGDLEVRQIENWLDKEAHEIVWDMFQESITDQTKKLFEEEEQ